MVLPGSATYTPARTSGAAITAIVLAVASFVLLPLATCRLLRSTRSPRPGPILNTM